MKNPCFSTTELEPKNWLANDLRIKGEVDAEPLRVPEFKANALPNFKVRLKWKKVKSNWVWIESQSGNEIGWTLPGVDLYSSYLDGCEPLVPGQVETRKYQMRYLEGDTPVSDWGGIVTLCTKGQGEKEF